MKNLHRDEKGLTLIELLIVVAILGILAAVIVPNLMGFIGTGKVAAANTEVANVESGALAYFADHDGNWPGGVNADLVGEYLNDNPKQDYSFDTWGRVIPSNAADWDGSGEVQWNAGEHKWEKTP